jgi:hypothetical protein
LREVSHAIDRKKFDKNHKYKINLFLDRDKMLDVNHIDEEYTMTNE